jgi:hemerythrin-like domain-containing protein
MLIMTALPEFNSFAMLDACHQQIHLHLGELAALARQIETTGVDAKVREQADTVEAFFSSTSHEHHAQEEKNVFPHLLASADAALAAKVRTLQQDHRWMEEYWIELAPRLRSIAAGDDQFDATQFQQSVIVFLALSQSHIEMEEKVIYPEAKARLARSGQQEDALRLRTCP